MTTLLRSAALALSLATTVSAAPVPKPLPFTGVNLAGGEFAKVKPGVKPVYGKDFVYPAAAEVDYFVGRGATVVRLPFRWEVLQPDLGRPLDRAELDRLTNVVRTIAGKGCAVILDPHNYARHYGKTVGGPDVPADRFADFWRRLATAFKADDHVWFGLMNEPHDLPPEQWLDAANAAVAAIRTAGAKNLILVPGVAWTGAHSWVGSGNAKVMDRLVDPADHFAFEVHQYVDRDSSGTRPDVVSPTIGAERLATFTGWCRTHHRKAFLGEFAAPDTADGRAAVGGMLAHMEAAPDVWLGWTWWAAGPWWPGDYMFSVEPGKGGVDRPQMAWLAPHFAGSNR